jgi:hypothetical protein
MLIRKRDENSLNESRKEKSVKDKYIALGSTLIFAGETTMEHMLAMNPIKRITVVGRFSWSLTDLRKSTPDEKSKSKSRNWKKSKTQKKKNAYNTLRAGVLIIPKTMRAPMSEFTMVTCKVRLILNHP